MESDETMVWQIWLFFGAVSRSFVFASNPHLLGGVIVDSNICLISCSEDLICGVEGPGGD